MKFGFLSTLDNSFLPYFINSAVSEGIKNISIIIDPKLSSEKDIKIFNMRTNGYFGEYSRINNLLFTLNKQTIPFYFVDKHTSASAKILYEKLELDCLVNAGTPRKITNSILDVVENGVINIHPGILPFYRGCSCVEWAIYNDEPIGNTAHFMSQNYDSGPIIEIEKYEFAINSNYIDIRNKVYTEGIKLASKVLKKLENKEISFKNATPQDESKSKFWYPIPEHLEKKSIEKANKHNYKYQIN
tara:strand:- start:350 stop:1081 length:732 start_codon:yes stop_codon:yes gene_type:complete